MRLWRWALSALFGLTACARGDRLFLDFPDGFEAPLLLFAVGEQPRQELVEGVVLFDLDPESNCFAVSFDAFEELWIVELSQGRAEALGRCGSAECCSLDLESWCFQISPLELEASDGARAALADSVWRPVENNNDLCQF